MRIRLFSEVTLFKYNVSTILSPIVAKGTTALTLFFLNPKQFSSDEKTNKQIKAFTRRKRSHLVYFIQSQLELSQNDTNKRSQQTEARLEPAIRNAQNVFQP